MIGRPRWARALWTAISPYKWRIVAMVCVLLAYVGLLVVAIAGVPALEDLLIAAPVLVGLVAGGNALQQWLGIRRTPPQFTRPERAVLEERDTPEAP